MCVRVYVRTCVYVHDDSPPAFPRRPLRFLPWSQPRLYPPPSWQWLVLWLDCDREGENIACDVRDRCLAVRKRVKVYRGRFSALIPQVGTSARM